MALPLLVAVAACTSEPRIPEMRQTTEHYLLAISADPSPPRAREPILYKIVVRDRESRQPIENGEGRIFANTADGARTYDGFEPGPEVGTYYARLNYVTSGLWAVGIQFRRDPKSRLEKTEWMQDVLAAREQGP